MGTKFDHSRVESSAIHRWKALDRSFSTVYCWALNSWMVKCGDHNVFGVIAFRLGGGFYRYVIANMVSLRSNFRHFIGGAQTTDSQILTEIEKS